MKEARLGVFPLISLTMGIALGLAPSLHAQPVDSVDSSAKAAPSLGLPVESPSPVDIPAAISASTTPSEPSVQNPVPVSPAASPAVPANVPPSNPAPVAVPVKPLVKASALKRLVPVAVMSFTGDGVSPKDLAAVTNRFESELLASDSFKIVERRNIDGILKEQGFQQSGACNTSECSVEIGQLLSVQSIFTGDLSKVGKVWSLSVKRTDVGNGQTMFSHVLDIQGSLEDVLRGGCPEIAQIASGRKKPSDSRTVLVAKGGGSLWPWMAGGAVLVGGGVAAVVLLTQDKPAATQPTPTTSAPDQLIVRW
ncbi:MAG: hypothetical protein RL318_934 [Fibrobacterota bacterium]|jgi:hypothetical protein